ncbi:class I SAM-dependent methyltransferase [Youngiibacter multivorans]|uniref:Ubiquinone/menaquinone biosynthesis C-methylase UbiE n=1 Tax=Youngiibacter multivorans TaxID=937251 RepID=A0ABS4G7J0_9CLOT|nr:class I SAM-dependent methyltransferase [Youngiibacter multivorans]MBP1920499.1 ubiquinone/menaquinone biosynthesis C-methylase UbiE [Youngiibacter multivorans]
MEEMFWEVHSGLKREAPGSEESTLRALDKVILTGEEPVILDIGCGPGDQTITIAKTFRDAKVMAVDTHEPFLDELVKRSDEARVLDRIEPLKISMFDMHFPNEHFDLVWAEGSAYIMGFQNALRSWRRLLKEEGYLGLAELAWLKEAPSDEAREFWNTGYPQMKHMDENRKLIDEEGYELIETFILPESDWWDSYYGPMEKRINELKEKYQGKPENLAVLEAEMEEIGIYRKHSDEYGYVFYVIRKN